MEIELPEGWRLGKVSWSPSLGCHQVTLFYKDVWSDKLVADESLEESVKAAIACPSFRVYPILFKEGKLDFTHHKCDKGIWKLIESRCITVKQGYDILPTANFIRTAKRKKVWNEAWATKSNYVHFNGRTYAYQDREWYDITNGRFPLDKKKVFRSVWDARVSFGRGECSLSEVAEYSWSAVLECVADLMTFNIGKGSSIYTRVLSELTTSITHPILRGFVKKEDWEPVFSLTMDFKSEKWAQFTRLLHDICWLRCSGFEAHLRYVNGYEVTIKLEHNRFSKEKTKVFKGASPTRLIHVPFLRHLGETLDTMTLTETRDYLQKKYSELFSIGPYTRKNRLVFFHHSGYYYGLWVDTGKIFHVGSPVGCWSIPFGYDRLPEIERKKMLGSAYLELDEKWCKQAKKARRSYYYFTRCLNMSTRRARFVVACKHLRTNYKQLEYQTEMDRYICSSVNRTARAVQITWGSSRKVA